MYFRFTKYLLLLFFEYMYADLLQGEYGRWYWQYYFSLKMEWGEKLVITISEVYFLPLKQYFLYFLSLFFFSYVMDSVRVRVWERVILSVLFLLFFFFFFGLHHSFPPIHKWFKNQQRQQKSKNYALIIICIIMYLFIYD